eukprot:1287944-Pyramimonas_sp.AAC.1
MASGSLAPRWQQQRTGEGLEKDLQRRRLVEGETKQVVEMFAGVGLEPWVVALAMGRRCGNISSRC